MTDDVHVPGQLDLLGHTTVLVIDGGPQTPASWITANNVRHWRGTGELVKAWRTRGALAAREQAPGLHLQRAHVLVHVTAKDNRRRDPNNWSPTAKACVDGLVDAGVLPDDDWRHLDGPDIRHGGISRDRALITLTITDLGDPL